jgi:hypothetical protein
LAKDGLRRRSIRTTGRLIGGMPPAADDSHADQD